MKIPCKECIAFAACKTRETERCKYGFQEMVGSSVFDISHNEKCERLESYLDRATWQQVNLVRDLFGMEII